MEEARRLTWMLWPPMPAPPVMATATRTSDDSTVWVGFQFASPVSALAAVLSAESLEATSLSADCRPLAAYWRYWMRVRPWAARAIGGSTVPLVSTPEARPESASAPAIA